MLVLKRVLRCQGRIMHIVANAKFKFLTVSMMLLLAIMS